MTSTNYEEFRARLEDGDLFIGVKPGLAYKFLTDTPVGAVSRSIGESLLAERVSVKLAYLLQFVTLFVGAFAGIFVLGWYNLLAIAPMVAVFFVLGKRAVVGRQSMTVPLIVVLIFLLASYFVGSGRTALLIWVSFLPLPFFFGRLAYTLSTLFVRMLVLRNGKAFDLLNNEVIFVKETRKHP